MGQYTTPEQAYKATQGNAQFLSTELNERNVELPVGLVLLGSGCGGLVNDMKVEYSIPYKLLRGMPQTTVKGHAGEVVVGKLAGKQMIGFKGRFHLYEGNTAQTAMMPFFIGHHLGVKFAITTAAGGVAPIYGSTVANLDDMSDRYHAHPGDVLVVESYDPNNLASALNGHISDEMGKRFNATSDSPSMILKLLADEVADEKDLDAITRCVYVPREGPDYETPAEVTTLSRLSADWELPVVGGMSLIPGLQAANQLKIPTLALAVVTNYMFDLAAYHAIEEQVDAKLRDSETKLVSSYKLSDAVHVARSHLNLVEPDHDEVAEVAGSEAVNQNLADIVKGVIRKIQL